MPTTRQIAIMDTTLRDGEQTPQLAYSPAEKLHIARALLLEVGVDRVEIASCRASAGEAEAARRVFDWARGAGCLGRVEALGFCDGGQSARWLAEAGGTRMNLLTKGSLAHCRHQLGKAPEAHFADVETAVLAAAQQGLEVRGAYLEDWSQGIVDAPDYVLALTSRLRDAGVERVYLADTLGCMGPSDVGRHVREMVTAFPDLHFELHCHNDYGLATANVLAAVAAGAVGAHTSVNGLGERAGNARLSEVVVALHDHAGVQTSVREAHLAPVAALVETFSGKVLSDNAPIVGRDVFTQTAGVHADGDRKAGLYETRLRPERFGRVRDYALGKMAGRASLDQNLERLGITLTDAEHARLLARIVELGDQKRAVYPEDLPYLINDLLGRGSLAVSIEDYSVTVGRGRRARAEVQLRIQGTQATAQAKGGGGYDALMSAVRQAAATLGVRVPPLLDFRVRIPPGGGTSALVETSILWGTTGDSFTTVGVDADQIGAAVIATEKMLARSLAHGSGRPAC